MSLFGKSKNRSSASQTIETGTQERGLPPTPKTVIGKGTRVVGDVHSEDMVTIEGEIQGSLVVKNHVIVGKTGRVAADLKVQSLQVYGTVEGDVVAKDRVSIEQSGAINGNVSASKLAISEGAIFKGNIDMSEGTNRKLAPGNRPGLEEVKEA